jgi:hypothetical protein
MLTQKLPLRIVLLLVSVCIGWGQSDVAQRILTSDAALKEDLRLLTDEIGGRVSGTAQFDKAAAWAVTAFRQAGADVVRTEEFSIPQS